MQSKNLEKKPFASFGNYCYPRIHLKILHFQILNFVTKTSKIELNIDWMSGLSQQYSQSAKLEFIDPLHYGLRVVIEGI